MKKILLIFVTIMFIAAGCDYSNLSSAQSKSRQEWKIYTNEKLGYSISYPPDWYYGEFIENEYSGVAIHNFKSGLQQPPKPVDIKIIYTPNNNPKKLDLENYLKEKHSVSLNFVSEKSNVNISNQLAIKEVFKGDADNSGNGKMLNTRTIDYILSRGQDIVEISCILNNDIPEDVVTNIALTFKFTK
jgi:hypothetical protein